MLEKVTDREYASIKDEKSMEFIEYMGGIDSFVGCQSRRIYEEYCDYCKKMGKEPTEIIPLMRAICMTYDCTTIVLSVKGKKCRVLVRKPKVA